MTHWKYSSEHDIATRKYLSDYNDKHVGRNIDTNFLKNTGLSIQSSLLVVDKFSKELNENHDLFRKRSLMSYDVLSNKTFPRCGVT